MKAIHDIRTDYKLHQLLEENCASNPIDQFEIWWQDAIKSEVAEINAMTLCTVDAAGMPDGRIVLLKEVNAQGFSFFTNYNSAKGQQLLAHPNACLVFFWQEVQRQVRIKGTVQKLDDMANDAYYYSRPKGSQLGAIASPQSQILNTRSELDNAWLQLEQTYENQAPIRPQHWGGYLIVPQQIEFWQGRPSRLHDRLLYTQQLDTTWHINRLAP